MTMPLQRMVMLALRTGYYDSESIENGIQTLLMRHTESEKEGLSLKKQGLFVILSEVAFRKSQM